MDLCPDTSPWHYSPELSYVDLYKIWTHCLYTIITFAGHFPFEFYLSLLTLQVYKSCVLRLSPRLCLAKLQHHLLLSIIITYPIHYATDVFLAEWLLYFTFMSDTKHDRMTTTRLHQTYTPRTWDQAHSHEYGSNIISCDDAQCICLTFTSALLQYKHVFNKWI